jgi:hypothetical protein
MKLRVIQTFAFVVCLLSVMAAESQNSISAAEAKNHLKEIGIPHRGHINVALFAMFVLPSFF